MSLLMDALRKAELAKRQGQSEGVGAPKEPTTQGGLALELVPDESMVAPANRKAGDASSENLPSLPSHLETIDDQFLAEAQQAAAARLKSQVPAPAPVREPRVDRAPVADTTARGSPPVRPQRPPAEPSAPQNQSTAKNVFAAKQADKPPARKAFAITIGVVTALSVCGIGGYFWWQLQPKSALMASRIPPPVSSAPVTARPAPVAATPAPVVAPPAAAPPTAAPVASVARTSRPTSPGADDNDEDADTAASASARPRRAIQAPVAPTEPDGPIRITKAPLKVNPALTLGFDAFNRGDLATAQAEYERAQKSDPRNTDALHGLAAIAVRQGRADQAEWLYKQITEADPHDTVAIAALINMRGQVDPGGTESKLKSLSAAQPELAAPHFSLGNLYARHGRWNDAQQAYFRAYSAEPDNPDVLYNLAISLEHLRQNKLAAQYYAQAIAAAQNRPAGFDRNQATARLNALQP